MNLSSNRHFLRGRRVQLGQHSYFDLSQDFDPQFWAASVILWKWYPFHHLCAHGPQGVGLRHPAHILRISQEYQVSLFCHNSKFPSVSVCDPVLASLKFLPLWASSLPCFNSLLLASSFVFPLHAWWIPVQPPGKYPGYIFISLTPDPPPSQSLPWMPTHSNCTFPLTLALWHQMCQELLK